MAGTGDERRRDPRRLLLAGDALSGRPGARLRSVHQLVPTLAYGDAVGSHCLQMQHLLWQHGVRSELFAGDARREVRAFARRWRDLAREPADGSVVLVHVSTGSALLDKVAGLRQRRAVVYHSIAPSRFFEGISDDDRRDAELGRAQLKGLARVCDLGIGVSEFDRQELQEAGFARTAVVPLLLDWSAYTAQPSQRVLRELADERTDIVVVGEVLPQKALHDVLRAFARYRERDETARLHLLGAHAVAGAYLEQLRALAAELALGRSVSFVESVPLEDLVAYYRGATAYLTLSDHEGFCAPLLEAMRFDLPVVAHSVGAIPETLGDAGLLLTDKSPDRVADALERVVRDAKLRSDLVVRGRLRAADFSARRIGERLREAFATAGWELAAPRRRSVAVVSSDQRCGVHDYSRALCEGLRENGHQATFVGVRSLDSADLQRKVRQIPRGIDTVVVEHEAGIFRDVPFVRALLSLWRRRMPVVLSLHELDPEKFHHYRMLTAATHYHPRFRWFLEGPRIAWVALRIANWFLRYRTVVGLMGALPSRIVVHSDRSAGWVDLLSNDKDKIDMVPLMLMPLDGARPVSDEAQKRALRARLGLPQDRFIFISPGFFFSRKRFIEVLEAAPADSLVVLSGTRSGNDPGYFDQVMRFIEERRLENVVVNTDFATMGEHVAASDCVVLYYRDIFQSAIATQAVWAGLPAIYSDVHGFRPYEGAGLVAAGPDELVEAMRTIQEPEVYARAKRQVGVLQRLLAPERQAARYLVGLG